MNEGAAAALPPAVDAFLAAHHVMTLATVDAEGPWAAAVFYAHDPDGPALVFLSAPSTRHARALAADARCAATVQRDVGDWREVTGLQIEGRVERLHGERAAAARARYATRFPIVGAAGGAPAAIAEALARVAWYALRPRRVLLIDNRRGFGHRDAWVVGRDDAG